MCCRHKSAAVIVSGLQVRGCTGRCRSHPIGILHLSFRSIQGLCRPTVWLGIWCAILAVFQHVQASQQETRGEVAPVDAAIQDCSAALYPQRLQSLRQLRIAPAASRHLSLDHQARLVCPFRYGLGFRLTGGGFGNKGNRATYSVHDQGARLRGPRKGVIESILAHGGPGTVYLRSTHLEVIPHA